MSEEVRRLGVVLKAKRKEMHLTLKEIENATSIRSSYIEAIEEGKINEYISGVYAQGFIKQYISYLGMDADKLLHEHPLAFKSVAEKHEFSYGIGTLEVRGSLGGGVKWLPNLMWAGVSAAVILMAYFLAKYMGVL